MQQKQLWISWLCWKEPSWSVPPVLFLPLLKSDQKIQPSYAKISVCECTQVSKESSAKQRLLQLIQLTEIQRNADSQPDSKPICPFRKGHPSSRCSRAVHVLLGFALPQTARLTFLMLSVMSRLTLGNCTEQPISSRLHSSSSSSSGSASNDPVCEWGVWSCREAGTTMGITRRGRISQQESHPGSFISKNQLVNSLEHPVHICNTQQLMRHSCTYKITNSVLLIYITDWALCHWFWRGKTRLSPRYKTGSAGTVQGPISPV